MMFMSHDNEFGSDRDFWRHLKYLVEDLRYIDGELHLHENRFVFHGLTYEGEIALQKMKDDKIWKKIMDWSVKNGGRVAGDALAQFLANTGS